jgi:sigma-54 dependent transcriptional regulator, acetoin dehydrogenase operon transcriptional activator AcoR
VPLTPAIPRSPGRHAAGVPHLFEVLDCAAPGRKLARHPLTNADEVVFCRGDGVARDGVRLRIGIPDRFISEAHARLCREGHRWRAIDNGSTNGTFVNGEPAVDRELEDGDVLEMGATHFLFRAGAPVDPGSPPHPSLATFSPALAAQLAPLPAIARSMLPAILAGPTGTGKELLARALHELSGRQGPFVAVNCAAIAPTLLESELFGHRKGAFTGAVEGRPGLMRSAEGGTLLLDEVADLSPPAQAALLRVLQEREVLPVGATEPVRIDVRVLAATHVELETAVAAQRFRSDLYARLAGFSFRLPPLDRRREDLGLLIGGILRRHRGAQATFTADAGRALLRHRWPGNIRELEQCVAAALVLAGDGPIEVAHLPESVRRPGAPAPAIPGLRPRQLSAEDLRRREQVATLLRASHGNVAAVARSLGKARMQVHRWVKRFDLSLADYR